MHVLFGICRSGKDIMYVKPEVVVPRYAEHFSHSSMSLEDVDNNAPAKLYFYYNSVTGVCYPYFSRTIEAKVEDKSTAFTYEERPTKKAPYKLLHIAGHYRFTGNFKALSVLELIESINSGRPWVPFFVITYHGYAGITLLDPSVIPCCMDKPISYFGPVIESLFPKPLPAGFDPDKERNVVGWLSNGVTETTVLSQIVDGQLVYYTENSLAALAVQAAPVVVQAAPVVVQAAPATVQAAPATVQAAPATVQAAPAAAQVAKPAVVMPKKEMNTSKPIVAVGDDLRVIEFTGNARKKIIKLLRKGDFLMHQEVSIDSSDKPYCLCVAPNGNFTGVVLVKVFDNIDALPLDIKAKASELLKTKSHFRLTVGSAIGNYGVNYDICVIPNDNYDGIRLIKVGKLYGRPDRGTLDLSTGLFYPNNDKDGRRVKGTPRCRTDGFVPCSVRIIDGQEVVVFSLPPRIREN